MRNIIKAAIAVFKTPPAWDTIRARLYDIVPHRQIDADNPVPFVAKALKQIDAVHKRNAAAYRQSVRAVGKSRTAKDKAYVKAATLRQQAFEVSRAADIMHDNNKSAQIAKQAKIESTAAKLSRASKALKELV